MAKRSPKHERRAQEVMRTMRALANLPEDDWQQTPSTGSPGDPQLARPLEFRSI